MSEIKKNNLISRIKDIAIVIGFVITFGSVMITWSNERTKRALLEDQVERNSEQLDKYNLEIINYRLDEIDNKLEQVLDLLAND